MRSSTDKASSSDKNRYDRQYSDSATRTIPRRPILESSSSHYQNNKLKNDEKLDGDELKPSRSFLPRKSAPCDSDLGPSRIRSPDAKSSHLLTPSELPITEKAKEDHSDSSRLCKYLSPTNYYDNTYRSQTPSLDTERSRLDQSYTRRSRFLRPDFYDNKDGNYFLKEKKERELETQKVLKEIRERRRSRCREINGSSDQFDEEKSVSGSTDEILQNVSDNIKKIENNVQDMHDYVNLPNDTNIPEYVNVTINEPARPVIKKSNTSKISRPKSYPAEKQDHKKLITKIPELSSTKSKIAKPKKVEKDAEKTNKNKFLHSIEKKFEKLRSFSNSPTTSSSEDTKCKEDKKSSVEDTIKRLREQSLPRSADITESGLIKRAVSVEDLTTSDPKQLQASRKSVTKILNLFKKYEEKSNKKSDKNTKTKKPKEETKTKIKNKSQLEVEKTDKNNKPIGAATVINNDQQSVKVLRRNDVPKIIEPDPSATLNKKIERPSSLLLDCGKSFHTVNNGGNSDCNISVSKDVRRGSKLPINSFRRSLNLENSDADKFLKNQQSTNNESLGLEVNHLETKENRNSFATTDESSLLLSPFDDNMSCDSWSICSDYHTQELTSPVSPCGTFYSADENESVSDRIRRKSFYTRFNEKKRPRKSSLNSYRDLDLYKDMNCRKSNYRSNNFDSEPEGTVESKSYYGNVNHEPLKYKCYGYNQTDNTDEVYNEHFPNRYQTYNPRFCKRSTSVSATNTDGLDTSDEFPATGKHKMYSYYNQPSRIGNRSTSPVVPAEFVESSMNQQRTVNFSTSQNHV